MRLRVRRRVAWAALAGTLVARAAAAAGDAPSDAPAVEGAAETPPPALPPPPAPTPTTSSPIERLPPSAFPTTPIRGIEGGSLWLTFHGQEWPYYPKTGIGVSGYGWIDTGYEHIHRGDPTEPSEKYMVQQGRVVLRVTPTWSDGSWFVQGQAELVASQDQSQPQPISANADDVWIKFGKWNTFDVQVGRFEAWEIYHFGMGLDLYTLERQGATDQNAYPYPAIYGLTYAFYRPESLGEAAVHFYATNNLRFELGGRYGNETSYNTYGGRPVAVLDYGWIKVKAGAEYLDSTPLADGAQEEKKESGYGGALQFVIDPIVEFGVNAAVGNVDHTKNDGTHDARGSYETYSLGAFLNFQPVKRFIVGGGINYTYLVDQQYDSKLSRNEDFDQTQLFGAVQYRLWNQLFIKAVGGYALANFNPNEGSLVYANQMVSGRLRLQFLF